MSVKTESEQEIRLAEAKDAALVADILAEAFADDPVMNWIVGSPKSIPVLFRILTRDIYLAHGFGHVSQQGAATLWLPPNATATLPFLSQLRIAASVFMNAGPASIKRMETASQTLLSSHPKEPHYYLFAVGVRKTMQGNGLGGAIVKAGLKRVDQEASAAYLENSKPRNAPLYERLGFEGGRTLPLHDTAPPLIAMLRPPQRCNSL